MSFHADAITLNFSTVKGENAKKGRCLFPGIERLMAASKYFKKRIQSFLQFEIFFDEHFRFYIFGNSYFFVERSKEREFSEV